VTSVVMWEAKAAPGRFDALLAWTLDAVRTEAAQVYANRDDCRVVVIATSALTLPEPPGDLVARPPHSWPFDVVEREG
jgi:hypothetical protein